MVSNRYRANTSITNKTTRLSSQISTQEKRTADPNLSTSAVSGGNIDPNSVTGSALDYTSVNETSLGQGATGSENLGVVNQFTSDSNFRITLPGKIALSGANYPTTPSDFVPYPLVCSATGGVVRGGIIQTGTVDPYWTSGYPNVTLLSGAVVATTKWAAEMPTPVPGQTVKVAWNGTSWYILSTVVTSASLAFPYQISLSLQNGITTFNPATWTLPSVSLTSEGIVQVRGIVVIGSLVSKGTIVTTLPPPFRPDYDLIVSANGSDEQLLLIRRTGEIELWTTSTAGFWLSLSAIKFPAKGLASWSRFGIDAGLTFVNGWSSYTTTPALLWNDLQGGGAGTFSIPTSGGPFPSPNRWGKMVITTANPAGGFNILMDGGFQYDNRVIGGEQYRISLWVRSNEVAGFTADLPLYTANGTFVSTVAFNERVISANTWTQRILLFTVPTAHPVYHMRVRVYTKGPNPVGREIGLGGVTITHVNTGTSPQLDHGPLRIWKEPTSGQVFTDGLVSGGTANTTITGTLPASFQALNEEIFQTLNNTAGYAQWRVGSSASSPANVIYQNSGGNVQIPIHGSWRPATGGTLTWTTATMLNSWVAYGAPFAAAQYAKTPGGLVLLRGLIKTGAVPSVAFTLPVGSRPTAPALGGGLIMQPASNDAIGQVTITSQGSVSPSGGSNVWFSLADISLIADQ